MERDTIIAQLLRGDEAAYRYLIKQIEKPLINFIYRFVADINMAEDIFQETFVRFIKSLPEFKPKVQISTWLFTIAKNLCLDVLKKKKRHKQIFLDEPAKSEQKLIYFKDLLDSKGLLPHEMLEKKEDEKRLAKLIGRLPTKKKEALILRVFCGMSYQEISKITRVPIGTCKYRVHEAVATLAKGMGRERISSGDIYGM